MGDNVPSSVWQKAERLITVCWGEFPALRAELQPLSLPGGPWACPSQVRTDPDMHVSARDASTPVCAETPVVGCSVPQCLQGRDHSGAPVTRAETVGPTWDRVQPGRETRPRVGTQCGPCRIVQGSGGEQRVGCAVGHVETHRVLLRGRARPGTAMSVEGSAPRDPGQGRTARRSLSPSVTWVCGPLTACCRESRVGRGRSFSSFPGDSPLQAAGTEGPEDCSLCDCDRAADTQGLGSCAWGTRTCPVGRAAAGGAADGRCGGGGPGNRDGGATEQAVGGLSALLCVILAGPLHSHLLSPCFTHGTSAETV
ncbi:uncharacterized protein LOC115288527 [Suricata suricatta]|uniref:uncharacterized protein LOC115288527 n=1 Tax=Suricata suricatta TaxID=37032 RepID=UPI001155F03A|nr:uncharacterized protein LOC115288527 [Suricata suricatta]XP_029791783.1 uncharacterized protein LOC115288527 [Suricata suricatta]XP_029791784.1 uncharacterized protein LOC115288527 [Suricata suricatta]